MILPRRHFIAASCAAIPFLPALAHAEGNAPKTVLPPAPKIGALFPFSGADSLIGDEAFRGAQLAVDTINQAGGIAGQQVSLIQGDALDQTQVAQTAKSLISGDGVNLLLGTGVSGLAYPGTAAAELAQIPYIELNAPADGITGRNFKFLLRCCLTTTMLAAIALDAMVKRFPGKKIGLLFNTGATAGAIAGAALAQWQAQKITPLLSIGYPEDAADLHDPVSRLRRAGVEILLHAASTDDVLVCFQAMQDIGWKPGAVIGCGDGYGLRETAFALGSAFDGTYVSAAPYYPANAAGIATAYQNRFGSLPRSSDSLTAYVGATLVFDQLASLNGDTGKLLDGLRKTDLPAGALVNGWGMAFDKTGQNSRAYATLQQWRNGGLVQLD